MSDIIDNKTRDEGMEALDRLINPRSRRDFLKFGGAGIAALTAAACDAESTRTVVTAPDTVVVTDTVAPPNPTFASATLDFSSDIGVLNYAYALEQLEAAFYTMVVANPYSGMSSAEMQVMTDIRDHEVVHRDFLAAAIPALGGTAIPGLTPNFDKIDFGSRTNVLTVAREFEDLGVSAYNGGAQYITMVPIIRVAGKIVSVEARHASTIRDLISPKTSSFAPSAFDDALPPAAVLSAAAPFIRNTITIANGPTDFVNVNRTPLG